MVDFRFTGCGNGQQQDGSQIAFNTAMVAAAATATATATASVVALQERQDPHFNNQVNTCRSQCVVLAQF